MIFKELENEEFFIPRSNVDSYCTYLSRKISENKARCMFAKTDHDVLDLELGVVRIFFKKEILIV